MPAIAAALTAVQPLLDAGKTLATLADPDNDLIDIGGQLGEIATTLQFIEKGLYKAYEDEAGATDKFRWDQLDRKARVTALRTAKRALVDLAGWVAALEAAQDQGAG